MTNNANIVDYLIPLLNVNESKTYIMVFRYFITCLEPLSLSFVCVFVSPKKN